MRLMWPRLLARLTADMGNAQGTRKTLRRDEGFVLVAVIWISGLLAVMATTFAIATRSNILITRNMAFNTKAEFMADGIVTLTATKLLEGSMDNGQKFNEGRQFCSWPGQGMAGIAAQDQGGLVDLNTSSPALLHKLFIGIGIEARQATQLVADLQDFRDPDSFAVLGGQEPQHYPGRDFGPKNAPFEIKYELEQIPALNETLVQKLLPLVTVHNQTSGFDIALAPQELLRALNANDVTDQKLQTFATPSPHKSFEIDVVVETKEHARFYRQAILNLLRQPDRPYAYLDWRQGQDASDWVFPSNAPPCFN